MNTVLSLIFLLSQNTLKNDLMYNIAFYIIEHIYEMENKSIKQLAEDCYTSTSSIIKFYQLIGFDNYSEFKRQLLSNFEVRKIQLHEKHQNLTEEDLMNKIDMFSIQKIDREDFLNRINQIVDHILDKKRIYFYGTVFPINLIQSFCEDMSIMKVPVHGIQISRGRNKISEREGVHIILSLSGRYMQIRFDEYQMLCNTNTPTILFSKEKEYIGDVSLNIPLPETLSSDFDDIILLLILDIIKLKCYKSLMFWGFLFFVEKGLKLDEKLFFKNMKPHT